MKRFTNHPEEWGEFIDIKLSDKKIDTNKIEGKIDKFVTSDNPLKIAKLLSKGKYKLSCVGLPLAMEYLKDVGIDCIKPDIHICRILARLEYTREYHLKIKFLNFVFKNA